MGDKWFTLSEATALLPQIKAELAALQELVDRIEDQHSELQKMKLSHKQPPAKEGRDEFFVVESRIDFMRMEAEMLIKNFARKGVQLKMISPGLVDFPARLDGEEVLLCWREGEETITHYHGWNDGFMGRKCLPEDH
ncbi:DUF2203 domain-containing protein [Cohnella cholangitidis]|uniref:DUF2203 family protein n=1 Tax=Cohnella cholangitidis TaxID=2598458 RepID=A0A7G5BSJ2_9BACL|nr:DUF2203 domain-containing protein [Cohnella cholangitidis]QMV39926.1 DUF2203 family protein [Cohnella cholangitidis]